MSKEFIQTLAEINKGAFSKELTEALQELVLACRTTSKAGSISLTLKLKPMKGAADAMTVEHDYKVNSPEFERPADIMFPTQDGSLVRNNQTQGELPLRAVTPPPVGMRDLIDSSTGEVIRVPAAEAVGELRTVTQQ